MAEEDKLVPRDDDFKATVIQQDMNNLPKNLNDNGDAGATIITSETTPITIHRTSYTDNYPRFIDNKLILKRPFILSIDTLSQIFDCISLILLNIFVVIFYDQNKFARPDIFWAIYGFSCLSLFNTYRYDKIVMISQIGQYVLYLWFCDWNKIPLIIFSVLLFIMVSCKLLPRLIIRFCIDPTSYIVWQYVSKKQKAVLEDKSDFRCKCEGIFIVITTVPLFYFNQS